MKKQVKTENHPCFSTEADEALNFFLYVLVLKQACFRDLRKSFFNKILS